MSGRRLKREILALLAGPDLPLIQERLAGMEAKAVINALFSAICHADELVRWHAISCMGSSVARLAARDMEEARIVMRRLLWSLNDESGGIGWGAPESMAEIMACHKRLAGEYIHMFLSYMREDGEEIWQDGNYLEHEVLQRGLLWGAWRLSVRRRELVLARGMDGDLGQYLLSRDGTVRGLAALAVGELRLARWREAMVSLLADTSPVRVYVDGHLETRSVAELAANGLKRIDGT